MNNYNRVAKGAPSVDSIPYKLEPLEPGQQPLKFKSVESSGWLDRQLDKVIASVTDVFRSPF